MNQGHSGVKEVIQEKQSKHCLVAVGRGSFYPGTGMAQFQINYSKYFSVYYCIFCRTGDGTDELLKERKKKSDTQTKLYTMASSNDSCNFC